MAARTRPSAGAREARAQIRPDRASRASRAPGAAPDAARPRRACHLITRLIDGGAQRLALETAAHLATHGWDVELWAGAETGPEGSLWEEAAARGIVAREVPALVRAAAPVRDARALVWLARAFRRERFDLVHTHSSKAGVLGRLAAARAGVTLRVHTQHGWSVTPRTPLLARGIYLSLERVAARRSQRVIAVSEAVRDAGLAWGVGRPAQYRVIHGAVALGPEAAPEARARLRRELDIPEGALVLGTLGRLDHAKDPLGCWAALRPLLESDARAWAVFLGDGPLRASLAREIGRSRCAERVRLAGHRPRAARLLPALDLFFLGSRWEGFPLALLEAMACALPVVAYRVAGVGEAVTDGENGRLAEPGDREGWSAAVRELAGSAEERARLGSAARASVASRFRLEAMLAETVALYEELWDEGPAG